MKSENEAAVSAMRRGRWYHDACGNALALEFLGERWSLLVLRELMFGPRRFGELRAHLNGISAKVLTQRLGDLEAVGLIVRRKLPPPASVQVYALTAWGHEVEPVLQAMGRWATRSPLHDPTLPLSPASAMLSMRTMIDRTRAAGMMLTIGFRTGGDAFLGRLADGVLTIVRDNPDGADVVIEADPTPLVLWLYLKRPIHEAEAEGTMRVIGDRDVAARFADLFALPERIGPAAA